MRDIDSVNQKVYLMLNKFSPSEASVSVFEFTKLHPKFVLRYSLIYGVFQVVSVLLLAATGYFGIIRKMAAMGSATPSEQDILSVFSSLNWVVVAITFIVSIAFGTMVMAMALRKTVNNQEIGFYGLTWGKDENNLLFAMFIVAIIYIGSFFAAGLLGGILAAAGIAVEYATPVVMAIVTVAMIWFVVAVSQYGVISIANGRFKLKEVMSETKPQFWSYMGAYVLAFILAMIASLIIQGSLGAIFGMSTFNPENAKNLFPESFVAALRPNYILYYFCMGTFSGFINLAFVCVGSYAYHKKREGMQLDTNEV